MCCVWCHFFVLCSSATVYGEQRKDTAENSQGQDQTSTVSVYRSSCFVKRGKYNHLQDYKHLLRTFIIFFYIRFFAYIKYFQKFWRPRPMFYSSIYLHVLWSIVADQIWSWLCVECIASTKRAREETWKWTERSRGDKRAQMV